MAGRLFAAWQDEKSRSWHTIGRLTRLRKDEFEFVFTKGAAVLGAMPKDLLGMNTFHSYRSAELLPLFRNKLPSRNRPDFIRMANWLSLDGTESDFEQLAKFGLILWTDSTIVYPEPDVSSNSYMLEFFVHGVRYMQVDAVEWCKNTQVGAQLLPMLDVKNPIDPRAVALRPHDKNILLGYVPAFYASDFYTILSDTRRAKAARISVVKCNDDAPPQLRLLCRIEAPIPQSFVALNTEEHQPLQQPLLRAL